jgi:glycosyltransferase involved in cell wall biosynthesis
MVDDIVDTTDWNREPEVAVVLPCYNEADIIEKVVREFHEELNGKIPFEIIVCEDGSTDGTKDVLRRLSKDIPMKTILGYEKKGYAGGLKDGLKLVRARYTFFVDADGQHLASDFWKLYELREKYDAVSGWRVKRADNFYRRAMSRSFQFLARRIFGLPKFKDITAPFKLVRTDVARLIAEECMYMSESFWTEFTIRLWLNKFSLAEKPVLHKDRLGSGSTRVYKPWKIPKIATAQISGLLKLWKESNCK